MLSNFEIDTLNLNDQRLKLMNTCEECIPWNRGTKLLNSASTSSTYMFVDYFSFFSRLCSSNSVFTAKHYRTSSTDTRSDIVHLNTYGVPVLLSSYLSMISLLSTSSCCLNHSSPRIRSKISPVQLVDQSTSLAKKHRTLFSFLVRLTNTNKYFKKITDTLLAISVIVSQALLVSVANETFVLRV